MARILIAEDDRRVSSFLQKGLNASGFATVVADDGEQATALGRTGDFDLLILDLGLPERDGLRVIEDLRSRGRRIPVLVLTGRPDRDAATCLEQGADDYMTKPFAFVELLARVRARLRPTGAGDGLHGMVLHAGEVRLDVRTRRATVRGRAVDLTAREFALLETFMQNADHVLTREQLLSHVWGYGFDPGTNVVNVYVNALRKKLGVQVIETVRGAGYRLPVSATGGVADAGPEAATPATVPPQEGGPEPRPERAVVGPDVDMHGRFAIVVVTDIVDSIAVQASVGDHIWRRLRCRHDDALAVSITGHGGRIVTHIGSGVVATYVDPFEGLSSTVDFVTAMAASNLAVRAGVHAGVLEAIADGDGAGGLPVVIAARVLAHAAPNEILVSRTVHDLLLGGGFTFVDRGEHALEGLDATWRLYAVE